MNPITPDTFCQVLDLEAIKEKFRDAVRPLPENDRKIIWEAFAFAETKHEGQLRDEGTPYISHPIFAALLALEYAGTVEDVCTMLLHDTLEDTQTTVAELKKAFGSDITENVKALSHTIGKKKIDPEAYLTNIQSNPKWVRYKALDRLANLHSLYLTPKRSKKKRYVLATREIFYPIFQPVVPEIALRMEEMVKYIAAHPILPKWVKEKVKR